MFGFPPFPPSPQSQARQRRSMAAVLCAAGVSLLLAAPSMADPLGHWPLDDGSGSQATDISLQALHGTVEGGPAWSTGVFGQALDLDGVDDLVTVAESGASPLDLVTKLTLTLWIRPADLAGNRSLISKDGSYELDLSHAGTGSYSVRLNNSRRGSGDTSLVADAWQHVAVTWDGAIVRYYFQGQADGTASYIGSLVVNDKDLGLGGRPASYAGGSPQFLVDGEIDDVRIYDRVLSAAEILAVYQNQSLPTQPLDATPPIRSGGEPTGTLPYGTTTADLVLLTDESAECRYAVSPGISWASMSDVFDVTGGAYHSEPLSGLQNGVSYTYYVRCRDNAENANGDDYSISFDIEAVEPIDEDPPLLSALSPIGTVAPGTTQVSLALSTDEDAECRFSETPDTDFASMADVFDVTGGTAHSSTVTGLQDGTTRIFYVRCRDQAGNANSGDARIGLWVAEPVPGSGFHPTDLPEVSFYVESRHGFSVATCGTDTCYYAGDNVPLAQQYCDIDLFPNGCVRRWEDQSAFVPSIPFEPPEWTSGRDHGQDDLDKPGLVFDCLNGRPCVRGGAGVEQDRGFEIEPNQPIAAHSGPFSVYVLAKPVPQSEDFYYFGYAGTELFQRVSDDSLRLRIGFGSQIPLTSASSVTLNTWHLIEVHRDSSDGLKVLVDGFDLTQGSPTSSADFYFRFLFTVSRDKGFYGDMAGALVATGELTPTEQADVRNYFAAVYGLTVGDGSPPDPEEVGIPTDSLVGMWTFEDGAGDCLADNSVVGGSAAVLGPSCAADSPVDGAGYLGTALAFDGSNDEAQVSDATLDVLGELTLSAWVKTSTSSGYRSILDKRDSSTDGFDLYLAPGGKPFMRVNNKALTGVANLADGQWHHVVGMYDGNTMWLYVDGVLDSGRFAGAQTMDTSGPLIIGRSYAGSFNVLDGSVDQVRIYDRDLTEEEIVALFDEE